jgi:hypothetical protein
MRTLTETDLLQVNGGDYVEGGCIRDPLQDFQDFLNSLANPFGR